MNQPLEFEDYGTLGQLVEDVDYDMQTNRQIKSLNIGRMTANERERRKREIRAEAGAIALPVLKDMVDMTSSTGGPRPSHT